MRGFILWTIIINLGEILLSEKFKSFISILSYGCLWGILEFSLGGFLHSIHYPGKGYIMTAIGFTIMTTCLIRNKIFWHPIFIGLIAASFKLLNVIFLAMPLLSRGIINPAASIILESILVSSMAFAVMRIRQASKIV